MTESRTLVQNEILRLVQSRDFGKTICPSEVARSLFGKDWRSHMDLVRSVARTLAAKGRIVVTQRGEAVDIASVRGPIRLGRIR